ncbi:hypothetical protein [Paenibacillus wenxiniae]|uniref:DNA-binding protein n=1 Tax=Paenibacillus wenxiniae TaxID=1636843 RepID=A0ABW4RMR2_9BACL
MFKPINKGLTAKEISQKTGIKIRKVYDFMNMSVAEGGIPSFRVGPKTLLAEEEDVAAWWDRVKCQKINV